MKSVSINIDPIDYILSRMDIAECWQVLGFMMTRVKPERDRNSDEWNQFLLDWNLTEERNE